MMKCLILIRVVMLVSLSSAALPRLQHIVLYAPNAIGCGFSPRVSCIALWKCVSVLPSLPFKEILSIGDAHALPPLSAILLVHSVLLLFSSELYRGAPLVKRMAPLSYVMRVYTMWFCLNEKLCALVYSSAAELNLA